MSIESTADRAEFMNIFGVSVSISGVTGIAIWDDPNFDVLQVNSSTPTITIADSDFPNIAYHQPVIVSSMSFSGVVKNIRPDGTGISVIDIRKTQ